jgi:hypothetical protein
MHNVAKDAELVRNWNYLTAEWVVEGVEADAGWVGV